MSEKVPKIQHTVSSQETVPEKETVEDISWNTEKQFLEKEFNTRNDPRELFERILGLWSKHHEGEDWENILDWVHEHADVFLELGSSGVPDVADYALMVLTDAHTFIQEQEDSLNGPDDIEKSHELRRKILDYFEEHIDTFDIKKNKVPYKFGLRLPALAKVIWLYGGLNKDIRLDAQDMAIEVLQRGITADEVRGEKALQHMSSFEFEIILDGLRPRELENIAHAIAERADIEIDLREERLQEATLSERRVADENHFTEWIHIVTHLEGISPDAPHELQSFFGIKNFHHFPLRILEDQYKMRDSNVPYGVVLSTQYDHNDAFIHHGPEQVLEMLYLQLKDRDVHLRIVEVSSPLQLARKLLSLDKKYGQQNKISFAYVRAHGTPSTIQLGKKRKEYVSKKQLQGLGPDALKEFFVEKPNVIFDSCLVGSDGGLAQEVAKSSGGISQGPGAISHGIKTIVVDGDKDNLSFIISLNDEDKVATHVG